ncbi:MAG: S8 family serine peptidase [Kordiimonas sp.]
MKNIKLVTALLLTTCLAACGGNSTPPAATQTPTPPTTPPPPPEPTGPDAFKTAEYKRSWALDYISAADAYAAGYTGEGVTIGVLDFNFDFETRDLNYHAESADADSVLQGIWEKQVNTTLSSSPHGQAVAMVAAGAKDFIGTHGVAFDSSVLAVHSHADVDRRQETKNGVTAHITNPWSYMLDAGAKVINVSLGRAIEAQDLSQLENPPEGINELLLREDIGYAVEHGGLLVWAVGNEGLSNPDSIVETHYNKMKDAGVLDTGDGQLILAGAIAENGEIADFSNRAGFGADHYLVAPAALVNIYVNGKMETGNGTSFAAPAISGAAAVLFQAFPHLTAKEVADILFTTATDLGEKGTDEIYGRGLINLKAALQPIGQSASRTRLTNDPLSLEGGFTNISPVFGDAFHAISGTDKVMMLDSYNRAYGYNLSRTFHIQSNRPSLFNRLDTMTSVGNSHLSLDQLGSMTFSYISPGRRNSHLSDALPFAVQTQEGAVKNMRFSFSREISKDTKLQLSYGEGGAGLFSTNEFNSTLQSIQAHNPQRDSFAALFTNARGFALERSHSENFSYGFAISQYHHDGNRSIAALSQDKENTAIAVNAHVGWDNENWETGINIGALKENGSFLGSVSTGALAVANTNTTTYGKLFAKRFLENGWHISGHYTHGFSDIGVSQTSFIEHISTVQTNAFMGQVGKRHLLTSNDSLSLTFFQPLKAVSGHLTTYLPTSQNTDTGALAYEEVTSSLSPQNRELNLELAYQLIKPASGLQLRMNMLYQKNPGNRSGTAAAFLLQSRLPF